MRQMPSRKTTLVSPKEELLQRYESRVDKVRDPDESYRTRLLNTIKTDVQYGPLIAAVIAPLTTLLDIPALSEKWFTLNGVEVPDPGACITLSALSLTTNVLANIMLVRRFTVGEKRWKPATAMSYVAWCIKITFAIVNLALYGASKNNHPGYAYSEGFWAAVASVVLSGIIVFVLTLHAFLKFDSRGVDSRRIRVAGIEFILISSLFIITVGLEALTFSRLEHWSFFQGIYFSLVTVLTVGFGDFVPKTTAGRVLLFPFAVMSIALFAAAIGVFLEFLSRGKSARSKRWRQKYEAGRWRKAQAAGKSKPARRVFLEDEVRDVRTLQDREEFMENMVCLPDSFFLPSVAAQALHYEQYQLVVSTICLVTFWVVGAAVFSALEGYTFGIAMYFCYVFFLTIGYGDFAPKTAGGRVFFVVYALFAVPFVASFVLNSVSAVFFSLGSHRFRNFRRRLVAPDAKLQRSHGRFVYDASTRLSMTFPNGRNDAKSAEALARVVLGLAVRLESQATNLLIDALEGNGRGHLMLRADRNLQRRALDHLDVEPEYHSFVQEALVALDVSEEDGERKQSRFDMTAEEEEQLHDISAYRATFAALMASGSMLTGLEGSERLWFERRLEDQHVAELDEEEMRDVVEEEDDENRDVAREEAG